MSGATPEPVRVCVATGLGLLAADGQPGWRVTKDVYVQTSGITGVLVNDRVGPLPIGVPDRRGRYDTLGRTVHFADTAKTALAEVLQHLRVKLMSMAKDAAAIGEDVDTYRRRLTEELHQRGLPGPGEVPVDWQLASGLYRVRLPEAGWWVIVDCPETLNALSERMSGSAGQLTIGHICGDNLSLTTQLAQVIRDSTLDDGSLPVGVAFPSKTAYGRCWAWWNRRADDNLLPGSNDPKLTDSSNIGVPQLEHRRRKPDGRPTVADIAASLRAEQEVPPFGLLTIAQKGDGDAIGYRGLVFGGKSSEEPELAYELLRRAQGFGYATEAARAVLGWAAEVGYRRVWAGCARGMVHRSTSCTSWVWSTPGTTNGTPTTATRW